MSRLLDVLGLEKLPYVATLLFTAIGWGATHTVDRVLKSPILEYSTTLSQGAGKSTISVRIRNISHDQIFKNLAFVFLLPPNSGKFTEAKKIATAPAWEGDVEPAKADDSVEFELPFLHPNGEVELSAVYEGGQPPTVRLERADGAVRLVKPSVETFLVRHELCVVAAMITLWAATIVFLLTHASSGAASSRQGLDPKAGGPPT